MCRAPVEAATVLASAGHTQETILEEGPTTNTEPAAEDENQSTPAYPLDSHASVEPRISATRLFGDEDDVVTVPVRVADTTMDCFPSQKFVHEAGRVPGVKQCS